MIVSRIRSLATLAAAAWLALPALAQQNPILIGVSLTQSPPGSVVQGTQVKDGMEILKDIVNAKGGVLGRPIKLLYEDNQGIPEKGRAATEKLIGAKSLEKAVEVQSDYVKSSYESFVAEATKLGELYADLAREVYKPFESQFGKVVTAK